MDNEITDELLDEILRIMNKYAHALSNFAFGKDDDILGLLDFINELRLLSCNTFMHLYLRGIFSAVIKHKSEYQCLKIKEIIYLYDLETKDEIFSYIVRLIERKLKGEEIIAPYY